MGSAVVTRLRRLDLLTVAENAAYFFTALAALIAWLVPVSPFEAWSGVPTGVRVINILATLLAPALVYKRAWWLLTGLESLLVIATAWAGYSFGAFADGTILAVAPPILAAGAVLVLARYLAAAERSTPSRRAVLAGVTTVGLATAALSCLAVLGAWWWNQPSTSWACGSDDRTSGCVQSGQIEIGEAQLDNRGRIRSGEAVPRFAAGVSNDGEQVVVVVQRYEEVRGLVRATGSTLLLVDTSDGTTDRLLFDEVVEVGDSGEVIDRGPLDQARFSPDGSLVVAGRPIGEDGDGGSEILVFAVADGRVDHTLVLDQCFLAWSDPIALSADHSMVQCGDDVYELENGSHLYTIDRLDPATPALATSRLNTRDVRLCQNVRSPTAIYTCGAEVLDEDTVVMELDDDLEFYSFDPTGTLLLAGHFRSPEPLSRWRPRRSEDPFELQVIAPDTTSVVRTILSDQFTSGPANSRHAWSETGEFLLLYDREGSFAVIDVVP